ncbi:hypothetical protein PISMIDRAFT_79832, partial [Pisolithus microcarpus 441]
MTQLLPKDIPTLQASSSGNWTRPDNVFGNEALVDRIESCETCPQERGPNTDHVPILTQIDLTVATSNSQTNLNYREVDWTKFRRKLKAKLELLGPPRVLANEEEFQASARGINRALQCTMESEVPRTCLHPHQKRWW